MPQEIEANFKFLERSLQHYENARKSFFRDLKVVAIVLLSFQFLIFARFIELNDEDLRLNVEIEQLRIDKATLKEVKNQLSILNGTLQAGQQQLTKQLNELPISLRTQILYLEKQINDSRNPPQDKTPDSTVSPPHRLNHPYSKIKLLSTRFLKN